MGRSRENSEEGRGGGGSSPSSGTGHWHQRGKCDRVSTLWSSLSRLGNKVKLKSLILIWPIVRRTKKRKKHEGLK